MTAPTQRPASNSESRKRLERDRAPHHDPAVCELMARAWDEGAAQASPYGGGYLRALYMVNPYRSAL